MDVWPPVKDAHRASRAIVLAPARGRGMESTHRARLWSVIAAVLFLAVAMAAGYRGIGLPPVVIVGGSGLIALVLLFDLPARSPPP